MAVEVLLGENDLAKEVDCDEKGTRCAPPPQKVMTDDEGVCLRLSLILAAAVAASEAVVIVSVAVSFAFIACTR